MGVWDSFFSLGDKTNRAKDKPPVEEGKAAVMLPELSLDMDDDELVEIKKQWLKKWEEYYSANKDRQEINEKYWLGDHYNEGDYYSTRKAVDNIIFEALETFLPQATSKNPEPMVNAMVKIPAAKDQLAERGEAIAKLIQEKLAQLGDEKRVKLRIKRCVRYWALWLLGAMKVGYSTQYGDIACEPVRTDKLVLDPDGYVNDDLEFTGEYIGEYKSEKASDLALRFPDKKDEITLEVNEKMGTKVTYVEWWTREYVFWTLKDVVLAKNKNPHWNYEEEQEAVDENGETATQTVQGINHFSQRKLPYVLLGVFNLSKGPYDDTSLIGQNIPNQDSINKRELQIDRNVDWMNGGWIISGRSGLDEKGAADALEALRKGKGLYIPDGVPRDVAERAVGTSLPADVYNERMDKRNELKNIFGTRGSTPSGIMQDQTVTGKSIIRQLDDSRAGGGVGEYVEQFADNLFNWFVQLMYVYYTPDQLGVSLEELNQYKLNVSIKTGSLVPKDAMSVANQSINLSTAGLMDPITMFDKLDYSNPKEMAKKLYLWRTYPDKLFANDPEIEAIVAEQREAARQAQAEQEAKDNLVRAEQMEHEADLKVIS